MKRRISDHLKYPIGRPDHGLAAGDGSSFINGQDIVVNGGHSGVTKGWSYIAGTRGEMLKRLKEAAAKL